jgi:hypothetical protein
MANVAGWASSSAMLHSWDYELTRRDEPGHGKRSAFGANGLLLGAQVELECRAFARK